MMKEMLSNCFIGVIKSLGDGALREEGKEKRILRSTAQVSAC